MQIIAGMIADRAVSDEERGRINLSGGGVAGGAVASRPAAHAELGLLLAIRLDGTERSSTIEIDLHCPDDSHRSLATAEINVAGAQPGVVRWIALPLLDIPCDAYGPHRVELRGAEIPTFSLPLNVQAIVAIPDTRLQ